MFYEFLFDFFDSIPTWSFSLYFLLLYLFLHKLAHQLLLLSSRFSSSDDARRSYILCAVVEAGLLAFISWFGLTAMSRGDVSLLDTSAHAPNPQIMVNMATMYAGKDLVGLLLNKRIAKTTVVHHICVFMAYFYVLSVITDDYRQEGIFKSFIAYASFTTLDFPYELFLAVRFFISRDGVVSTLLKRYALLHNIFCVTSNMVWQLCYLVKLYSLGILYRNIIFYLILIVGWVQEERVVMLHLWNL